jgi:Domain of unknown function (DUF4350)
VRQKVFIFGGIILLAAVLIGLNAAAFSRKNVMPDSELKPNRSTYNTDATGTRAVYDLLAETGRKVTRWQEKPSKLLANNNNKPSTFVIIGKTRRPVSDEDAEQIMRWVSEGGKLVIIDRSPLSELIKTTADREIKVNESVISKSGADPTETAEMTGKSVAVKPTQPTVYTRNVNAIMPSIFASQIELKDIADNEFEVKTEVETKDSENVPPVRKSLPTPKPTPNNDKETPQSAKVSPATQSSEESYPDDDEPPPIKTPTPKPPTTGRGKGVGQSEPPPAMTVNSVTPFAHFATGKNVLLADFPYGNGEIVFLSDPYIVANNGISLADNAQLAINLLSTTNGITAFDEYHQGYGTNDNRLFAYFEGTPVIAVFAQLGLFAALFFWSSGRRFARPLPFENANRLSKLEYVGAMAEIQANTKAYDLAIENIFAEFRRKLIRFGGADNTISNENLADIIAERSKITATELTKLMNDCVAIRQGEPTNKREVFDLVKRIREIEESLGIKRGLRK